MRFSRPYPPRQFAVFRILFGLFLALEFAHYGAYAARLWGADGALVESVGVPGVVWSSTTARSWRIGLGVAALLSLAVAAGIHRRIAAGAVLIVWVVFHARTAGISVPSHGFIGFFLLALVVVPAGEPMAWAPKPKTGWSLPPFVFAVAWLVVGVAYSLSGWDKLESASWRSGRALSLVFNSAIVRPGPVVEALARLPDSILTIGSYAALLWELLFLPLALLRSTRRILWWTTLFFHLGIWLTLNIGSVNIVMLIIQVFLYEGRTAWTESRAHSAPKPGA